MKSKLPVFLSLAAILVLTVSGCNMAKSTGYRDQAHHSLEKGGDATSSGRSQGISEDAVQLWEFLYAYDFGLDAEGGTPLKGRFILGGSGADQEKGEGYLMFALNAPDIAAENIPPRYWSIAIDTSYSMQDGERWDLAMKAANRLVARLRSQDRVTIITFGAKANAEAEWVRPADALKVLSRLKSGAKFGRDAHDAGLTALSDSLWEARSSGHHAIGFYISEMEGAPADITTPMANIRGMGGVVNVLGIAGGNEVLLREFARASSGSYIFIADAASIERNFGDTLSETFDCAALDVKIAYRIGEGYTLSPADYTGDENVRSYYSSYNQPAVTDAFDIGGIGPGSEFIQIWRVSGIDADRPLEIEARIMGRDASGRAFYITAKGPDRWTVPGGETAESRAFLKAITISRQVEVLRQVVSGNFYYGYNASFEDVMAQIRKVADDVRKAQEVLDDPEFARDLEGLEAASKITEADLQAWLAARNDRSYDGPDLLFPVKVVAGVASIPVLIVGYLLLGIAGGL